MARNWSDLLPEDQAAIRADLAELDIEGRKGYLKDLGLVQKDGLPTDDSFWSQAGQGALESLSGLPDLVVGTPAGAITTLAGKVNPDFLTPETFERSRYPVRTGLEALRRVMGADKPPEPQTSEGQMGKYFGQGAGDMAVAGGILSKLGQGMQYATEPGKISAAKNAFKSIPIAAYERYLAQPSAAKSLGNIALDTSVAGIANVFGKEAEEAAPDSYKPAAYLLGSTVGGLGPQMAAERALGIGKSGLNAAQGKFSNLADNSIPKNLAEGIKDAGIRGYHWLRGTEPPVTPPEDIARQTAKFVEPLLPSGQFKLDDFRANQEALEAAGITKATPLETMALPKNVGAGVTSNLPIEIQNQRVAAMSTQELAQELARQEALRKEIFTSLETTAPSRDPNFNPISKAREELYNRQSDLEMGISRAEQELKDSIEGQIPMVRKDELGQALRDRTTALRERAGEEAHKKFLDVGSSAYKVRLPELRQNKNWYETIDELDQFRKGKAAFDDAALLQLDKDSLKGYLFSPSDLQTRRRILSGKLNSLMRDGQAGTDEFRLYTKALKAFDDSVSTVQFPDNPEFGAKWGEARTFYKDNVTNVFKKPIIKTFVDVDANGELRKIYPERAADKLWKPGEVTSIKDFRTTFGDTKEIQDIALDSLNQELTKAARNPNANVAKVFEGWKTKYRKNLSEMPNFAKSLDSPVKALDKISTQRAAYNDQLRTLQKTSLYKLIDKNFGEDPVVFGERILRDPGAREDFFNMLSKDQNMYNAGRRFLWDSVKNEAGLTPQTMNSERLGAAIQTYQDAIQKHFTPEQTKSLETIYKALATSEQTRARGLTMDDISPNLRAAKEATGQTASGFMKNVLTAFAPGNPFGPSARRRLGVDLTQQFRNKKNLQAIDTLIENPKAFEEILKAADQVENASSYVAKKKAEYGLLQRLSAYGLAHGLGETVRGEE